MPARCWRACVVAPKPVPAARAARRRRTATRAAACTAVQIKCTVTKKARRLLRREPRPDPLVGSHVASKGAVGHGIGGLTGLQFANRGNKWQRHHFCAPVAGATVTAVNL